MADMAALSFALRDTYLNAIMVEAFMAGLYTLLFGYTTSLLLSQPKYLRSNLPIYTFTALLYIFSMIHFAFQWYFTRQTWIIFGATSDTSLEYMFSQPLWLHETCSVLSNAGTLIADGILVWRCWVIWGKSWMILVGLGLAWIGEFISSIFALIFLAKPLNSDEITADPNSIYLGLSLAVTVLCTSLISYRIIRMGPFPLFPSTTVGSGSGSDPSTERTRVGFFSSRNKSPYMKVIEIITESAAIYSLALIVFLPMYTSKDVAVNFPSEYMKRIVVGITGMAPTLIVARVILAGPSTSSSSYSSSSRHPHHHNGQMSESYSRGTTATFGPIGVGINTTVGSVNVHELDDRRVGDIEDGIKVMKRDEDRDDSSVEDDEVKKE